MLKAKQPRANSIPATASRSTTTVRGVPTVSMIVFGTPSYGISLSADQRITHMHAYINMTLYIILIIAIIILWLAAELL
jgi:hypothetical protein